MICFIKLCYRSINIDSKALKLTFPLYTMKKSVFIILTLVLSFGLIFSFIGLFGRIILQTNVHINGGNTTTPGQTIDDKFSAKGSIVSLIIDRRGPSLSSSICNTTTTANVTTSDRDITSSSSSNRNSISSLTDSMSAKGLISISNNTPVYYSTTSSGNPRNTLIPNNNTMTLCNVSVPSSNKQTLDDRIMGVLPNMVLDSIMTNNKTSTQKTSSSTVQTAFESPYIVTGDWNLVVNRGNVSHFAANLTMVRNDGTDRHTYKLNNFRAAISGGFNSNAIEFHGKSDLALNDNNFTWRKQVDMAFVIKRYNTVDIILSLYPMNDDLNGQPIYGVVNSLIDSNGKETVTKNIKPVQTSTSISPMGGVGEGGQAVGNNHTQETKGNVSNNTAGAYNSTQLINKVIGSLDREGINDIISSSNNSKPVQTSTSISPMGGVGEGGQAVGNNHTQETKGNVSNNTAGAYNNTTTTKADEAPPSTNVNIIIAKGSQSPSNGVFFNPSNVTVKAGTTATWINEDSVIHTATPGDWQTATQNKKFETSIIEAGKVGKPIRMPYQEGNIPYYCQLHPFMTGTITVVP
jgi:plastocyanin